MQGPNIPAWDCPCGARNSHLLSECYRCGAPKPPQAQAPAPMPTIPPAPLPPSPYPPPANAYVHPAPPHLRPCPVCGHPTSSQAASCPACGQVFAATPTFQPKVYRTDLISVPPGSHSPLAAVLLGLLCCAFGGQLYNQQYLKGVVMGLIHITAAVITSGVSSLITLPVLLIDAGMIARKLNRGQPVGKWDFF